MCSENVVFHHFSGKAQKTNVPNLKVYEFSSRQIVVLKKRLKSIFFYK